MGLRLVKLDLKRYSLDRERLKLMHKLRVTVAEAIAAGLRATPPFTLTAVH